MTSPLGALVAALGLALVLVGCGGSGGEGSLPSSTRNVTTYYDPGVNTFPRESGAVQLDDSGNPTAIKHGRWTVWFPPEQGNTTQMIKTYVNGVWDRNQYWREWNADTSIRLDWQDR